MSEAFRSPQQFGVNLGEFLHLFLELAVMLDAGASGLLLVGGFEEELVYFAHSQALGQVVKRAVLGSALMAMAVGFAAAGKPLDQGSP
jgi:hypothetical protein